MNNYFVILAAGKGKRFNNKKPKQYHLYKNKELFKHSIDKSVSSVPSSKGFNGGRPSTSTDVSQGLYEVYSSLSFLFCSNDVIIGTISLVIAS